MECPACQTAMEEVVVQGIAVDVCKEGCGGLWFDNFELQKVDEPHEAPGEELVGFEKNPSITVDRHERRLCPKCQDTILMRHFFSVKREVEVDECPKCGGLWLDCGELGQIRHQFPSEAARKEAFDAYFDDVFGEELQKMRLESEEKLRKARSVAKAFRFICPSYYIPGDQDGGAF